jgi:hypothetical protein
MSRVAERLGEMGVTLPSLPTPIANDVPAKRAGNLWFTAGQVSAHWDLKGSGLSPFRYRSLLAHILEPYHDG